MAANLNCLRSACEEAQYPIAEWVTEAQIAKFANQFHGGHCIECLTLAGCCLCCAGDRASQKTSSEWVECHRVLVVWTQDCRHVVQG